jgi:betaine-aldehyde dehydrogenase
MQAAVPSFVDGRRVHCSGETFVKLDPSTGSDLAWLHKGRQSDVDAAMAAAHRGFRCWSAIPVAERLRILRRAAELMRERDHELASLEAQETGRPLEGVTLSSVRLGADCLDDFANAASMLFEAWRPHSRASARTRYEPRGVCVGVGSAHRPLYSACVQAAPALAAGNAVVFKPSELAPIGVLRLAEILLEAGLPPGVFNVVQGRSGTAGMIIGHRDAADVMNRGTAGAGSCRSPRQSSLGELAGDEPSSVRSNLIVFNDADIEAASRAAVSTFDSHGFSGNGGARVFVQRSIVEPVLARLSALTSRLRLGRPMDRATDVGPLISSAQLASMLQLVTSCVATGARLVAGGHRVAARDAAGGFFIAPTILADCTDEMTIASQGVHGPLLYVLPFDTECEVVQRVNAAIDFGGTGIFTRDTDRANRVVRALKSDTCWVDPSSAPSIELPWERTDTSISALPGQLADLLRFTRKTVVHTGVFGRSSEQCRGRAVIPKTVAPEIADRMGETLLTLSGHRHPNERERTGEREDLQITPGRLALAHQPVAVPQRRG